MNTQLVNQDPTLPGLLPNVEVLRLAQSFRTYDEGGELVIDRMPSAAERHLLIERSQELGVALQPIAERSANQVEAGAVIAALLVGYGISRNDKSSGQTIAVYIKHLESVPLFAIKAACDDVRFGRVYDVDRRTGNRIPLDPDYPPSTVRLRMVAQKHIDAMFAEKYAFDKVLRAKRALPALPSEAERARVSEQLKGLARDIAARSASEDLEGIERAARRAEESRSLSERLILAEYARLGMKPERVAGILVSPELARKHIGLRAEAPSVED
jgi:hypothetical protein